MKRTSIYRKLLVVAGCAALIGAVDVGVSYAATGSTTATGTVVVPISITKVVDLNFGKFMVGASLGTVVVDTANLQTTSGGATSTAALGAGAKAATFTVAGETLATYAITYSAAPTLTGPGTAIPIGTFTTAVTGGGSVGTLPVGGSHTLIVGATASVEAGQAPGVYSGNLDVTVNYN